MEFTATAFAGIRTAWRRSAYDTSSRSLVCSAVTQNFRLEYRRRPIESRDGRKHLAEERHWHAKITGFQRVQATGPRSGAFDLNWRGRACDIGFDAYHLAFASGRPERISARHQRRTSGIFVLVR